MVTDNGHRSRGWICGGLVVLAVFLALAFSPVGVVRAATIMVPDCMGSSLATAITTANTNTDASNTITFAQDCLGTTAANTITLTSTQTIIKNLTIDGAGHTVVISGGDTVRLFRVNRGVTFTVNMLTLTNGHTSGSRGGAIFSSGTLIVTNSTLRNNNAYSGGGISNFGGTATVTGSTLSGNSASNDGGGISNAGTLTVTNSTLSGNSAPSGFGGGIFNQSTLTLTNSTLSGNSAPGSDSGGGIFNQGTLTVTGSTLSGNSAAGYGGGGIYNDARVMTVTNSTLSGNSAPNGFGGGIFTDTGTVTVTNNTLSGNSASNGGGIYTSGGTLTVTNSTLSGNSAPGIGGGFGGGIRNDGTVNAANTLIVNNTPGDVSGTSIAGTNNITGSFTFAGGLQNNGGPTQTLALPPGSPALGAGDLATCTNPPVSGKDQRGFSRPDASTTACDIGAFESQGFTVAKTTGDMQSVGFGSPTLFAPLTATVTSKDSGVTVNTGTLTFVIVPGTSGATFGAAGGTGCTVSMDGHTASGCAVNGMGVVTSPPFMGTNVGGFTVTVSATPGDAAEATYTETVTQATPTVSVTSSVNPSSYGQSVTFTATVTGVSGTTPTGSVQFAFTPMGGMSTPFGMPVMLTAGMGATATASITTTALPVGTDTITATYSGDGSFTTSNGMVAQTVTKALTTTSTSAMPVTSTFGQSVTLTATVSVTAPGAGTPSGSVAFTLGSTALGSGTVNGMGIATASTTALPVGANQTVTATYSGDGNFSTSSGTTSVTVNAVTITLTAPTGSGSGNSGTASAPSIRAGSSITLGANPSTGVTYTSSNPNIAAVDATTGVVTGIAGGTVTITVNGPNGSSGSIVVTVTGGTGGGLVAPAPGAHPAGMASTAGAGATPVAAPPRKADGTASSSGSGVSPQVTGATATPTPTPDSQPARH